MAHIRTWADINERGGDAWLTEAEKKLIAACKAGDPCKLENGKLPPEGKPTSAREIRADVLRYLILGGCNKCPVDDIGISLRGAHVTGKLKLDFATTHGAIRVSNSRFDMCIESEQIHVKSLALSGSALKGLHCPNATITGGIFLQSITTSAEINFDSAHIGGQLNCYGATFDVNKGDALNAQGATITRSLILRKIKTVATIELNQATIGGQLNCRDSAFDVVNDFAMQAQDVKCTGGLIWRDVKIANGILDFNSAHFDTLRVRTH